LTAEKRISDEKSSKHLERLDEAGEAACQRSL